MDGGEEKKKPGFSWRDRSVEMMRPSGEYVSIMMEARMEMKLVNEFWTLQRAFAYCGAHPSENLFVERSARGLFGVWEGE